MGGTITYTWTFTDLADRPHAYTNVTLPPVLQPAFGSPPADITVNCNRCPPVDNTLVAANNDPQLSDNRQCHSHQSGSHPVRGSELLHLDLHRSCVPDRQMSKM
ncbi:MAG: hypothetical protein IPP37_06520 [Saprospiraceae bacterium]|nr:hypothetical protein [Saprospiraceae bacterium]